MSKLLQINSSLFNSAGQSTQLADYFVENYLAQNPGTELTVLDLAAKPVPHLDSERFEALIASPEQRTDRQNETVADADRLLKDVQEASAIVLALPLYNFGIPSVLKAYFDHLARAGVSFRYTENGPVGLLEDKPVYVIAARGGIYKDTPLDTQSDYIRHFLSFIGLKDLRFIYAEGLNLGDETKEKALERARKHLLEVAV